ncbi:MAG: hypothetical protein KY429_07850 [Actinobacteria bacterium]|nr:hypothetical protein [Actinomycetota bacterium]
MDNPPPVETPASPPKAPRWVKVFAIIAIVVVLIVVVALVAGGGKHGPRRHMPDGDNGEHNPPAQYGP